ncbi:hypothetical protein OEZ60_08430 [Defluviimonas sp. WL0024]|uniref:Uncharacterized protein n=2 Tax=Albidovulum TaxID=205889 RepID=A0ABT3J819_9RHOB|nr:MULTISPECIES: hypothetical protein [Defluviimonas]MCU9848031.1 hypothetical protein [Defluviimonas sp. WL0024]MCW3783832.1 hypothetical protein [Defluviimonas salinarum]
MKPTALVPAFLIAALPALAWETEQTPDSARTWQSVSGLAAEFGCRRGQQGYLDFRLTDAAGGGRFAGIRSLMLWIELADGRTARYPVDVAIAGPSLIGRFYVSAEILDHFQNGTAMIIDSALPRQEFLRTDMKGTGAARLAFRERCGL